MATYGNIYYAGWQSPSKQGYLYIDKLDYVGTTSALILKRDGFTVSTNWQFPILGMTAEFSIMNLETDFFTLLPLLSGKEAEYRVRIETTLPTSVSLFEGFLNCDTVTQKYLHRQSINFVASSYISKLENIHPVSIDTLQNITFIKLINEILRSTGCDFNIRVNSVLRAEGDTLSAGHTLFDKNGFFTELFWIDNVERNTSLEILQSILTSFNCYLYWHNKHWYIERYDEIWDTSVDYVEYSDIQCNVGVGDVVTVAQTVLEVHDLVFTDTSQTLAIVPGLKTIKINLNDQRYTNLTINDFKDIITVAGAGGFPAIRTWEISDARWNKAGESFLTLSNSIQRRPGASWVPLLLDVGLATSFRMTILSEDDSVEIKFGYVVEDTYPEDTWKIADYTFRFYYYVRSIANSQFIVSDGADGDKVFRMQYAANTLNYLQYVDVSGADFDVNKKSVDVSLTIPMGLIDTYELGLFAGKLTGDQSFTLCIGAVTMYFTEQTDEQKQWELATFPLDYDPDKKMELQVQWARFGDVSITETGEIQSNVVEGTLNSNYLNKEELSLDLYDAESYSYKNAILRGGGLENRTEIWGILAGTNVVNARGVCYSSTHTPPDLTDAHTHDGTGFGVFNIFLQSLSANTLYYVRAYATDGDGGTVYGAERTFTTLNLVVGSTYEGGIIGYIFAYGDVGYVAGETHGLIVSVGNLSDAYQLARITGDPPFTADTARTALGGGIANSAGMLANASHANFAISLVKAYNDRLAGGFDDWFLPCWFELTGIWKNRAILKMSKLMYWTSSEPEDGDLGIGMSEWKYAYAVNFGLVSTSAYYPTYYTDNQGYWKKTHGFAVRAVRQF